MKKKEKHIKKFELRTSNFDELETIEDIEAQIYTTQIQKIEQDKVNILNQLKVREEFWKRFYALISTQMSQPIDKDTIKTIDIPDSTWGEVIDEVFGRQNDLIRPSHRLMPYSIIQKDPVLEEFLPYQSDNSGLARLVDKSTTRTFEIINEFTSENTEKAHKGDLVYWQAWLSVNQFNFYNPITENEILKFIIDHTEGIPIEIDNKLLEQGYKSKKGTHKLATIKRRIASLSIFLDKAQWSNPCRNKLIKDLLSKLTKKYGGSKSAGKAITKDILDDMLETTKKNTLIDIRDRALLLFAWASGGRRRSEVATADIKNLTKNPDGDFIYNIERSKTDQEEKGNIVPIKGRAAKALTDWLNTSKINEGKIFRGVDKYSTICKPIADVDVYRIVRKRLKKAGYDETQYGAHSLRSGFVTTCGHKNIPLGDVMQMTTHRSIPTVMKYYQNGNIINNKASNLAD